MRTRSGTIDTHIIYCGDCLDQLRKLPAECVDLVYIDPPFNSNRNYEVFWGETKEKRAFEDRHESTKAYIDYMRPRITELGRVLKRTGSFYYHCDWHASHYVKVMLDQIFGENNFRNEIIWKRSDAHNDAKGQMAVVSDSIFFYTGSDAYTFNVQRVEFPEQTLRDWYIYLELSDGTTRRMTKAEIASQEVPAGARRFNTADLRSPNPRPNLTYDYKGYKPHKNGWAVSRERMEELEARGLLLFPKSMDGRIMRKNYLDESEGPLLGNVWTDISQLRGADGERLGYPTQKPLRLLERILEMNSSENDIVLDAFCGCGTALVSAHQLNRQWIGIDISPTACRVMAERLRKICKLQENEKLWEAGSGFIVRDLPRSEAELRRIPPFEFENWAVIALGGVKNKVQVGDMGIDGRIYPVTSMPEKSKKEMHEFDFMDQWYPIQVKQKGKAGRPDIDSFEAVMQRENRTKGFFVSFGFSSDAMTEIGQFFRRTGKVIVPLTVREILDDQIAQKLARPRHTDLAHGPSVNDTKVTRSRRRLSGRVVDQADAPEVGRGGISARPTSKEFARTTGLARTNLRELPIVWRIEPALCGLLRNTRKTECGAKQFLARFACAPRQTPRKRRVSQTRYNLIEDSQMPQPKTEMIHARIDPKLKRSAEGIFSQIGVSTAEAIRLFLKQVELHGGLPFPVSIPNKETIAAMAETNRPARLKRYRSFREVRGRL